MKVFARYFSEDGFNFRLNTVLQFGKSWDVIGAAILINPGSANPIGNVTHEDLHSLTLLSGKSDHWREFSMDSTMRQLEKIFNKWYIGEEKSLNGVILLFNLFNLREQDLEKAIELLQKCKSSHCYISDSDMKILSGLRKVYLGWGQIGKIHTTLRQYAEPIFSKLYPKLAYYLQKSFDDNPFYHPGFINRSYKRSPNTKDLLNKFWSLDV